MNSQTVVMCVVALILGMLLANMLKNVCGCKVVEGAVKEALAENDQGESAGSCVQELNTLTKTPDIVKMIGENDKDKFKSVVEFFYCNTGSTTNNLANADDIIDLSDDSKEKFEKYIKDCCSN